MAKVVYGIVAGALAALVAGFFVETTALPLFVSVGLSALAVVLIVAGWSRHLRRERELGLLDEAPELEEIAEEPVPGEGTDEDEVEELEDLDELEDPDEPEPVRAQAAETRVVEAREAKAVHRPSVRGRPQEPGPSRAGSRRRVVVVPGRRRYHLPSCRFASASGAERVNEGTAVKRGCEPCSVCKPDS